MTDSRVAIVGATGPTGRHLAAVLAARGRPVRAISRRPEHLSAAFGEGPVERVAADALDREGLAAAVAGCGIVVDAIGLPPERMEDHPRTAANVVAAAGATSARILQISSYWSFLPHRGEVVDERHPRAGAASHPWFRLRREAEDVILAAGGAVVHLPDFFGPEVHTSSVQNALEEAVAGKPVSWIGSADTAREAAFVPDAMTIVADLIARDEAYGTDWAIPGAGPLSGRRLAAIAGAHLGREVKVRAAPAWLLGIFCRVVPALRPLRPLVPHYGRPVRYDASKLLGLLGAPRLTPFTESIPATLNWIRAER